MGLKKNSFWSTHEVLDLYSNETGVDRKLIEAIYYFYVDKFREELKKPETIELHITNLGTVWQSIYGCKYAMIEAQKGVNPHGVDKMPFLEKRHAFIIEKIAKIADSTAKTNPFLWRFPKPWKIKNT